MIAVYNISYSKVECIFKATDKAFAEPPFAAHSISGAKYMGFY